MKIHTVANFTQQGTASLPNGNFRAVGIAPGSEVDVCKVGGRMLSVGGLVPFNSGVEAVRGIRKPNGNTTLTLGDLELVLYEACDPLMQPGPRAPTLRAARVKGADLRTTPARDGVATTANLRIPFQGRRHATFFMRRTDGTDFSFIVVGVKYRDRALMGAFDADVEAYFDESATDTWSVSGVVPVSGLAGGGSLSAVRHVGGFDSEETYDELELYCWGAAGGDLYIQAEADGERNR